ncbi:MAG: hypothetical protein ABWY20_05905 [Mycobacterium sp.]
MPSRLPILMRPAADEIAVSYLNRLATLHEIPFLELWPQVSRPRNGVTRPLDADLLAAVADQPRERLAHAVIELRAPEPDWLAVRHEPQRGCWRCNAHTQAGPCSSYWATTATPAPATACGSDHPTSPTIHNPT